jgi:predicted metal-dependent HD superfamily phosphohydrolase
MVLDDLPPHLAPVAARYAEPHRRHHTTAHLERVLGEVEALLELVAVPDPEAVRLAALFHDAVYDPRSATNEAESAALARAVLAGREPEQRVADVERLVLATTAHAAAAPDEAVLLDADLAVLADPPAAYAAYVAAVRAEYAWVDDAGWRSGRARVLRSLLDLPSLFSTGPFAAREAAARANLEAELAAL